MKHARMPGGSVCLDQESEEPEEPNLAACERCRNHGVNVPLDLNHAERCPHALCLCAPCLLTSECCDRRLRRRTRRYCVRCHNHGIWSRNGTHLCKFEHCVCIFCSGPSRESLGGQVDPAPNPSKSRARASDGGKDVAPNLPGSVHGRGRARAKSEAPSPSRGKKIKALSSPVRGRSRARSVAPSPSRGKKVKALSSPVRGRSRARSVAPSPTRGKKAKVPSSPVRGRSRARSVAPSPSRGKKIKAPSSSVRRRSRARSVAPSPTKGKKAKAPSSPVRGRSRARSVAPSTTRGKKAKVPSSPVRGRSRARSVAPSPTKGKKAKAPSSPVRGRSRAKSVAPSTSRGKIGKASTSPVKGRSRATSVAPNSSRGEKGKAPSSPVRGRSRAKSMAPSSSKGRSKSVASKSVRGRSRARSVAPSPPPSPRSRARSIPPKPAKGRAKSVARSVACSPARTPSPAQRGRPKPVASRRGRGRSKASSPMSVRSSYRTAAKRRKTLRSSSRYSSPLGSDWSYSPSSSTERGRSSNSSDRGSLSSLCSDVYRREPRRTRGISRLRSPSTERYSSRSRTRGISRLRSPSTERYSSRNRTRGTSRLRSPSTTERYSSRSRSRTYVAARRRYSSDRESSCSDSGRSSRRSRSPFSPPKSLKGNHRGSNTARRGKGNWARSVHAYSTPEYEKRVPSRSYTSRSRSSDSEYKSGRTSRRRGRSISKSRSVCRRDYTAHHRYRGRRSSSRYSGSRSTSSSIASRSRSRSSCRHCRAKSVSSRTRSKTHRSRCRAKSLAPTWSRERGAKRISSRNESSRATSLKPRPRSASTHTTNEEAEEGGSRGIQRARRKRTASRDVMCDEGEYRSKSKFMRYEETPSESDREADLAPEVTEEPMICLFCKNHGMDVEFNVDHARVCGFRACLCKKCVECLSEYVRIAQSKRRGSNRSRRPSRESNTNVSPTKSDPKERHKTEPVKRGENDSAECLEGALSGATLVPKTSPPVVPSQCRSFCGNPRPRLLECEKCAPVEESSTSNAKGTCDCSSSGRAFHPEKEPSCDKSELQCSVLPGQHPASIQRGPGDDGSYTPMPQPAPSAVLSRSSSNPKASREEGQANDDDFFLRLDTSRTVSENESFTSCSSPEGSQAETPLPSLDTASSSPGCASQELVKVKPSHQPQESDTSMVRETRSRRRNRAKNSHVSQIKTASQTRKGTPSSHAQTLVVQGGTFIHELSEFLVFREEDSETCEETGGLLQVALRGSDGNLTLDNPQHQENGQATSSGTSIALDPKDQAVVCEVDKDKITITLTVEFSEDTPSEGGSESPMRPGAHPRVSDVEDDVLESASSGIVEEQAEVTQGEAPPLRSSTPGCSSTESTEDAAACSSSAAISSAPSGVAMADKGVDRALTDDTEDATLSLPSAPSYALICNKENLVAPCRSSSASNTFTGDKGAVTASCSPVSSRSSIGTKENFDGPRRFPPSTGTSCGDKGSARSITSQGSQQEGVPRRYPVLGSSAPGNKENVAALSRMPQPAAPLPPTPDAVECVDSPVGFRGFTTVDTNVTSRECASLRTPLPEQVAPTNVSGTHSDQCADDDTSPHEDGDDEEEDLYDAELQAAIAAMDDDEDRSEAAYQPEALDPLEGVGYPEALDTPEETQSTLRDTPAPAPFGDAFHVSRPEHCYPAKASRDTPDAVSPITQSQKPVGIAPARRRRAQAPSEDSPPEVACSRLLRANRFSNSARKSWWNEEYYGYDLMEKNARFCVKCRNHELLARTKGHKGFCPFEVCPCVLCSKTEEKRSSFSERRQRVSAIFSEGGTRKKRRGSTHARPGPERSSFGSDNPDSNTSNTETEEFNEDSTSSRRDLQPPAVINVPDLQNIDASTTTTSDPGNIDLLSCEEGTVKQEFTCMWCSMGFESFVELLSHSVIHSESCGYETPARLGASPCFSSSANVYDSSKTACTAPQSQVNNTLQNLVKIGNVSSEASFEKVTNLQSTSITNSNPSVIKNVPGSLKNGASVSSADGHHLEEQRTRPMPTSLNQRKPSHPSGEQERRDPQPGARKQIQEHSSSLKTSQLSCFQGSKQTFLGSLKSLQSLQPALYTCIDCDLTFHSVSECLKHRMTHHARYRSFRCSVCSASYGTILRHEIHSAVSHSPFRVPCPMCPERFPSQVLLSLHLKCTHDVCCIFSCPLCTVKLSGPTELLSHINSCHPGARPFSCDCGEAFSSLIGLKVHLRVHAISQAHLHCPVCFSWFPAKALLDTHMLSVHNGDKPYICPICSKDFHDINAISTHVGIEHPHSNCFLCKSCRTRFTSPSEFLRHITDSGHMAHRSNKVFKCRSCQVKSADRLRILDHEEVHHMKITSLERVVQLFCLMNDVSLLQ